MWVAAHAPERVERLVLCCTTAQLGPAESWRERAAIVRADGAGAIADAVLGRWFTPGFAAAHPDVIERMREILSSTDREGYAGCCEAIAGLDVRDELSRITAPTLVISSAEDQAIPAVHQRAIADAIPGARLETIGDAAHIPTVQHPPRVNELILEYIDL